MGLTWEEVEASAQDRHWWRLRVALCIGDAGWIKVKVKITYLLTYVHCLSCGTEVHGTLVQNVDLDEISIFAHQNFLSYVGYI